MKRKLPRDCEIHNIRFGVRPGMIETLYAELRESNGDLLISSTLDYIVSQLNQCELVSQEEWNELFMGPV